MKRIALLLGFLLATPGWCQAHFLWLLTDASAPQGKVQVYFGEAAEPDDPALLDKVANAEVWVATGRGEPKLLKLTRGADALESELTGAARQSTVFLRQNYGVISRGGEPFLLKYYAKTYPFALPGTWRPVSDRERLPLEIAVSPKGAQTVFQVLWNGKPLAGSQVTVVGPGVDKKLEGTTDEAGNFACELPRAGTFSIRAKHSEATAGMHEDHEYKSIRHYATLTLHHQPARLAPATHSLPDLPKGVTSFGAAIAGNALYVYGGNYGSAHEYANEDQSGDLWKLNLATPGQWEIVSTGPRLQGLAMVEFRGGLYRIGGFTATNKSGEKQNLVSQDEFARFDPASGQWHQLPRLPEPRSSHDAAMVGSTLYVVGGWNMQGGGPSTKWHDTALAMDLAAEKLEWKSIPAPFHRRALSVAAHQNMLVCIGGMTDTGGPTTQTSVFDPATQKWTDGPALNGTAMDGFGTSSFAAGKDLYVTTVTGSIQRLSAAGKTWDYLGQLAFPRFFHRLLVWNDSLIIVGGASMEEGKAESLEILKLSDIQTAAR